jgi:adenylate kinase
VCWGRQSIKTVSHETQDDHLLVKASQGYLTILPGNIWDYPVLGL